MKASASRKSRAQVPVIGVLAFSLVLLMALVLSDMAVRTAAKTRWNMGEAEMEQIAIAATNDLVLNPTAGLALNYNKRDRDKQWELNDHILDAARAKNFPNDAKTLQQKWETGDCTVALGIYYLDGAAVLDKKTGVESRGLGKFVFRRLVVLDEKGNRRPGYLEFEIAC